MKVIETIELTQRYLDELFEDVTDDQVRANEAEYNRRLKALTDTLPQFADIWIIDPDGHPLVSGTVFPMPPDSTCRIATISARRKTARSTATTSAR